MNSSPNHPTHLLDAEPAEAERSLLALEVVRQVYDLVRGTLAQAGELAPDGLSFEVSAMESEAGGGVLSMVGRCPPERDAVLLHLELLRGPPGSRIPVEALVGPLATLGERYQLCAAPEGRAGGASVWVALKVRMQPLSFARQNALAGQLLALAEAGRALQRELPRPLSDRSLEELHRSMPEHLAPVLPYMDSLTEELAGWARRAADLLRCRLTLALESPSALARDLGLALLASALRAGGQPLGWVKLPVVNERILEISAEAPGPVVVSALSLGRGVSPYDMAAVMRGILSGLREQGGAVVIAGSDSDLRSLFHGGQGAEPDPRGPVVVHLPSLDLALLARFGVQQQARRGGGISPARLDQVTGAVTGAVSGLPAHLAPEVLDPLTRSAAHAWDGWLRDGASPQEECARLAGELASLNESLCGLARGRPPARLLAQREALVPRLTDPALRKHLGQHIFGQARALAELCQRLAEEVLTRPHHQPIRYCAEGTPGTTAPWWRR